MRKIALAVSALLAVLTTYGASAEEKFKLRASVDTSMTHGRTIALTDYLKKLQEKSGGRIETEMFHSGQLFRDRDVLKALRQGAVEMAMPGTWVLTGFVPDADVFQLPSFFGQSLQVAYRAVDGKIGGLINTNFEKNLQVRVLGSWLPLGYQNTYTTARPVRSFEDLAGMKIRNSGGAGQSIRARFFNAQPNVTAWPDVPLALSQGTFDGLSSTDESLASAKLWESGAKYGFADREFIGFYVPMMSDTFYRKLPPDLQALVVDVWKENIGAYRKQMEDAQLEARHTLEKNGMQFFSPPEDKLVQIRQKMMQNQDAVATELRISPAMQDLVKAEFKSEAAR